MTEQPYELSGSAFIIRDYDRKPPFSSFLPGLAGVTGIPLWSYYTNRGQGVCSFGIHHKGNAMMEFCPANTVYETTQLKGFRTFIRANGVFREPFFRPEEGAERVMTAGPNTMSVRETAGGLEMTVTYFILPNEDIGALVRHVTLRNLSGEEKALEILDGMPQIIPYGIQNGQYKEMSNLFRSWSDIRNLENRAPIYKMRAAGDDQAEMKEITGGWFFLSVCEGAKAGVIYDRDVIFGHDLSLIDPLLFREGGLGAVLGASQCFYNKVPCGFAAIRKDLKPGEAVAWTAYMGYAVSEAFLNRKASAFLEPGYAGRKLEEAMAEADRLTADVRTQTADPAFDAYIRQCYLDNFLRGGYPFVTGSGADRRVLHLFSRKHGDPERDYNFFSIAGEYYSQGNGNFRDVCQNRRMDCSVHPEIGDFDAVNFFSLIQADGYNPLEIRPCTFLLKDGNGAAARSLLERYLPEGAELVLKRLGAPFTPGQITNFEESLALRGDVRAFIDALLALCDQRFEAVYGEGYWSDHFDYILDLAEDYLGVWPEEKDRLLFTPGRCAYYQSPAAVRPRRETYVIQDGHVRQYGAVYCPEGKMSLPGFDPGKANWLTDEKGNTVFSSLFEKALTLAAAKLALLDCEGLGIEMDGGKPGWNDAMNGLPGLLGSSMAETLELGRLVRFLLEAVREKDPSGTIALLEEPAALLRGITEAYRGITDPFVRWDRVASLREDYRERVCLTVTGRRESVAFGELASALALFREALEDAAERALEIGKGVMPTFFTYEAVDFSPRLNADGTPYITPYGMPGAVVRALKRQDLPLFLEGPARYLSGGADRERGREMARLIRAGGLYDRELGMYKTSESLEDCPMSIGRVRVFTPGWLERESVFLHMEYKYLLGLMKAGLYDEFYEAASTALIPRLDPAVYGRSVLENSSFIASSVNPDPAVRGRGFVGRLSGSTAEMLSLWRAMFVGDGGFILRDGHPVFRFSPRLEGGFFDAKGEAAFTLCATCLVVYHNPAGKSTYGPDAARVCRLEAGGKSFEGDILPEREARLIREHALDRIDVYLE